MNDEPTAASGGDISGSLEARPSDVVVMPGRGLRLPHHLPFDRWLQVGRQLAGINSTSAWCLGDWLVYGQVAFDGRYRKAIERTSLDYQTLRNYAWIARRFPLSRRRDNLSFGHHAEAAALSHAEQDFWLRKAEESGWSVKQLRHQIHASLAERPHCDNGQPCRLPGGGPPDKKDRITDPGVRLELQITASQMENYLNTAAQGNHTLEEWVVLTLDQAAGPDAG